MRSIEDFSFNFNFTTLNQDAACELEKCFGLVPAHVYLQNRKGLYVWCNDMQAKTLMLSDRRDLCDQSTFDLIVEERAIDVTKNDQEVMEKGIEKNFRENAYISSKKALFNPEGEVIGMLGISIMIPKYLTDKNEAIAKLQQQNVTRRQAQCAYYFSKGKSAKEIADKLSISPRTVEKHLEHIRINLGFVRRGQLIEFLNHILAI